MGDEAQEVRIFDLFQQVPLQINTVQIYESKIREGVIFFRIIVKYIFSKPFTYRLNLLDGNGMDQAKYFPD